MNERESQFRDFMEGRIFQWLLVVKLTKARMEGNWARACDLEDDPDDSAVPEAMKMAATWLAAALAADLLGSFPGCRTSRRLALASCLGNERVHQQAHERASGLSLA